MVVSVVWGHFLYPWICLELLAFLKSSVAFYVTEKTEFWRLIKNAIVCFFGELELHHAWVKNKNNNKENDTFPKTWWKEEHWEIFVPNRRINKYKYEDSICTQDEAKVKEKHCYFWLKESTLSHVSETPLLTLLTPIAPYFKLTLNSIFTKETTLAKLISLFPRICLSTSFIWGLNESSGALMLWFPCSLITPWIYEGHFPYTSIHCKLLEAKDVSHISFVSLYSPKPSTELGTQ